MGAPLNLARAEGDGRQHANLGRGRLGSTSFHGRSLTPISGPARSGRLVFAALAGEER
jgi:hypothetical protein